MTTNEDILRAIGEVTAEVRATKAIVEMHTVHCEADRLRHETAIKENTTNCSKNAVLITNHLAKHKQNRLIISLLVALGAALASVAGLWSKVFGGA